MKTKSRIFIVLLALVMTLSSFTACGKPREFSVSFVVDNEIISVIKTNSNGNVELPTNPSKNGFTFGGWFLDEGVWQQEFTSQTTVTKDVSVYAYLYATEYVATFMADGVVVDTRTFTVNDTVIDNLPQVPVKKGWIGQWEGYTLGTQNITINAEYSIDMNGLVANVVDGTILNNLVNNFLHDGVDSLSTYLPVNMDGKETDYSKPKAVELSWENNTGVNISEYVVSVSETEDFENALTYTTSETSVNVKNLKAGTKYFWKVVAGEVESIVNSFVTEKNAPRLIDVDGVTNFRDLGGYATGAGTSIPQGLVYRCATVAHITDAGKETVKELGIKTEIDLRSTSENGGKVTGDASVMGEDVNYVFCPIGYSAINWGLDITDDKKQALQDVFNVLADANNYPVVFHCSAGADRTGFIAYAIKAILGVTEDEIIEDYLLTNFSKQNLTEPRYVSGLSKFTGMVKEQSGTTLPEQMENYLKNVWGISAQSIESIKTNLKTDIDVSDWNTYVSPEEFNYTIKVYKDGLDCTQDFTLPELKTKAYAIKDISSWANENVPEGYELDEVNSILKQRISADSIEFVVHYLVDDSILIADITSEFEFSTVPSGIIVDASYGRRGKYKEDHNALSGYRATEGFVDISAYQGKTLKITMVAKTGYGLVFYDEALEPAAHIKAEWCNANTVGELGSQRIVKIDIPVGAKYVRTTYLKTSNLPFKAEIVQSKEKILTSEFVFGTTPQAVLVNASYGRRGAIKTDYTNLSGHRASGFVDVSAYQGMTLQITMVNRGVGYGLAFYDVAEEPAAHINAAWCFAYTEGNTGDQAVVEIVIPEGAKYVRTTYLSAPDMEFSAIVLLNDIENA